MKLPDNLGACFSVYLKTNKINLDKSQEKEQQ